MVGLALKVANMEIGVVKSGLKLATNIAKNEFTTGNAHMAVNVISIKYLPEMGSGIVNVLIGIKS
jgi:hypothetical protein